MDGKVQYHQEVNSPPECAIQCSFSCIPKSSFLPQYDRLILKFIWTHKGLKI